MMTLAEAQPNLLANAQGERLRRARLLVVDDQPANIQTLYQVFSTDHQVFMATHGEQALALCAAQQPDLVLLDVEMPGMDGHEVCRRLKADRATSDIPVIFVTAHKDEASEAAGLDIGAVDFITKPINPRIVRARVNTHLTLKAQSDLLRHWVYIDGLTSVYNRRCFDERLASEWGRAVRNRGELSVLLLDVDHFKLFNDRYGHQAGDDCLRRIADALGSGLRRPGDLLARYGGEEFACLLPDTGLAGAMVVAEQLAQCVRDLAIEHAGSSVAPMVTISVGACSKSGAQQEAPKALLLCADEQLYAAKSRGRNQCVGSELSAA
jgi:diguanylate cyclase (GGDEF)-like protein